MSGLFDIFNPINTIQNPLTTAVSGALPSPLRKLVSPADTLLAAAVGARTASSITDPFQTSDKKTSAATLGMSEEEYVKQTGNANYG